MLSVTNTKKTASHHERRKIEMRLWFSTPQRQAQGCQDNIQHNLSIMDAILSVTQKTEEAHNQLKEIVHEISGSLSSMSSVHAGDWEADF